MHSPSQSQDKYCSISHRIYNLLITTLFVQNTANSSTAGNTSSSSVFSCNASSWAVNSSSLCVGKNYVGGVCSHSLLFWQECTVGSAEMPVRVDVAEGSQEQLNDDVSSLIAALGI